MWLSGFASNLTGKEADEQDNAYAHLTDAAIFTTPDT